MKIALVGDPHIRLNKPVMRTDDMRELFIRKFTDIKNICNERRVHMLIVVGDIFDKAKVSNETLLLAKECFEMLDDIRVYTVVGNHDMIGNSIENHYNSSLAILEQLVPNLNVLINENVWFNSYLNIRFNAYGNDNYDIKDTTTTDIIVTHSMITDRETMFESIGANDIESQAKLIVTGHNHNKFQVMSKSNTIIYNPGALIRLTAAEEDMNREVEIGILDTEMLGSLDTAVNAIERVILNIQPKEQVFKIEEIDERRQLLKASVDETLIVLDSFLSVKELTDRLLESEKVSENIKKLIYEYLNL